ncbi:MAG: Bro-N domain-containing protein [Geminicoccaceae bacterium]
MATANMPCHVAEGNNGNLIPFDFEGNGVRIIQRDDNPWFVGKDVCEALEIRNHNDALKRLDDDEKQGVAITDPLGGRQTALAINESGLYSLILTSRKDAAKRFKKWVTSVVLPTIRHTGSYNRRPAPVDTAELAKVARDLRTAGEAMGFQGDALANFVAANIKSQTGVELILPNGTREKKKPSVVPRRDPALDFMLTVTEISKRFDLGVYSARDINKLLLAYGLQTYERDQFGTRQYLPTEKGAPFGRLLNTGRYFNDGTPLKVLRWDKSVVAHLEKLFLQERKKS